MGSQDTLFTNMMKRLNLSSDEPIRSERSAPSAPPTKSVNLTVPLPGQTLESEDEVGTENHAYADNDSISHAVLNNVLKSVDLKRKDDHYTQKNARDRIAYGKLCTCGGVKNVSSPQVSKSSIGIQTSISESSTAKVITVNKSVQVSSPMLIRASHGSQTHSLSNSDVSLHQNYKTNEVNKKVIETSFINHKKLQNGERPGTPVAKLTKKINVTGEKALGNNNKNNGHGSYRRTTSAKSISSHGRRRRSKENNEIMTVIDIGEGSD